MSKQLSALIFDLDNTLVDRDRAFREVCLEFLRDLAPEEGPSLEELARADADGRRSRSAFCAWVADRCASSRSP